MTDLIPGQREAAPYAPPHDLEAEMAVLGAMLLSRDAIGEVLEVVSGGHFYRPAHATVFATIVTLYLRGDAADPITVAAELTKTGEIARAGGAPYLHELVQATSTVANAEQYALIVRERAALRDVITVNLTAANQAMRGEGTASEIIATQQQALQAVYDDTGDDGLDLLGPHWTSSTTTTTAAPPAPARSAESPPA
ncbi:DnaB-like helicase N-terminal domain-containing protein [Streptomyces sp. PA03-6a]|nr:DnaB-like helicase N-terminal domain-containing protein [Streptomyces sp. PA03-6a]